MDETTRSEIAALRTEVKALSKKLTKSETKLANRIGKAEDTALIPLDWINLGLVGLCVLSVLITDGIASIKLPSLPNPFASDTNNSQAKVIPAISTTTTADIPQVGEAVGAFEVTSTWGARTAPCAGCSSFHRGIDVGAPVGSPVYAIGNPGETVTVRCESDDGMGRPYSIQTAPSMPDIQIEVLHLSKCNPGSYPAGSVHSYSGDAGTGPHYHVQIRRLSNQGDEYNGLFAPPRWVVAAVTTGKVLDNGTIARR